MPLVQVPPQIVPDVWPLAAKMLDKAVAYSNGEISLENELVQVTQGQKQLWVVVMDEGETKNKVFAAGITSLRNNANGSRTAFIELFGGDNMKLWFDHLDDFKKWARDEGCVNIRLWARKGWAKHLKNFILTHYIMQFNL